VRWVQHKHGAGVPNLGAVKAALKFGWEEYEGEWDELRRMTQDDLVLRLRHQATGTRKGSEAHQVPSARPPECGGPGPTGVP
jgi:hypothetical protein